MPTGVYVRTEETKAKLSAALRGRIPSEETKAKLSAAARRRYQDPAEREKLSLLKRCELNPNWGRGGELNPSWRGDDIGSAAAHKRHRKALADQPCAHADETCKGRMEVSFNHDTPVEFVKIDPDGPYSPRTEDYVRLCQSHHYRYDNEVIV